VVSYHGIWTFGHDAIPMKLLTLFQLQRDPSTSLRRRDQTELLLAGSIQGSGFWLGANPKACLGAGIPFSHAEVPILAIDVDTISAIRSGLQPLSFCIFCLSNGSPPSCYASQPDAMKEKWNPFFNTVIAEFCAKTSSDALAFPRTIGRTLVVLNQVRTKR